VLLEELNQELRPAEQAEIGFHPLDREPGLSRHLVSRKAAGDLEMIR
jgi:hypothetical protein